MTAVACHRGPKTPAKNPLLEEWTAPYGLPPFDAIRAEHFLPALERGMSLQRAEIDAIVRRNEAPDFDNSIRAFDDAGRELTRTRLLFEMLCAAQSDDALRAVQETAAPLLAAHDDRMLLDTALFARIRAVYDRRGALNLTDDQLRLTERVYRRFVRAGALLDEPSRERLAAINTELAALAVRFGNNLLAENAAFGLELTAKEMEGLPVAVRDAARERAKARGLSGTTYLVTLDKPSLIPFLTYSTRRDLRDTLYSAYLARCARGGAHDNRQVVADMARLRAEKARLLGYDNYAAYVIDEQMARTPEAAYALLDSLWRPALDRAREELAQMEPLLAKDAPDAAFAASDWWFYAEKIRKRDYALDMEALRPYFSLENVQGGAFFLANRLYGITFRPLAVPLYSADCLAYEVLDEDESPLGVLIFDYFVREGKAGGAWCGNFTEQLYTPSGERVAPVVGVVCNFAPSTATLPSLLTPDEAQTLFHEFGHALHALFREVRYRGLSEVEGDFVELPSQLMENWAMHPEMLARYAVNYRTGELMPASQVERLQRALRFNKGFETVELVAAALADLDLHTLREVPEGFDAEAFLRASLNDRRGLIPQIEPRYRYPYFSHIFDGGYAAGYYFYPWSMVLEKDAFQAFVDSGDIFDRQLARAFREKVLARGGAADGAQLYRDFRGADPDRRPLLRALGMWEEPEPAAEPADSLKAEELKLIAPPQRGLPGAPEPQQRPRPAKIVPVREK